MKKCVIFMALVIFINAMLYGDLTFQYGLMKSIADNLVITDGTILGDSQNNDISFNNLAIGFDFTYNGQTYQQVSVNSNGFIVFGTAAENSYSVLGNGSNNQVFAGLNSHIIPRTGTNPGSLQIKTIGQAPTRRLVVQWKHYKRVSSATNEDLNFQIILEETYHRLSVVYNQSVYTSASESNIVFVGLRGLNGSDLYNLSTSTDWWDANLGGNLTDGCLLNGTVHPVNQFKITFEPSTSNLPPTQAEISFPQDNETGVSVLNSLGWGYSGGINVNGYKLNFGTDNPPSNLLSNRLCALPTFSLINLLSTNTTYYWQVIPYNDYGNAYNCPVWSFTTGDVVEGLMTPYTDNVNDCIVPFLNPGVISRDENNDGNSWTSVQQNSYTGTFAYTINGNSAQNMNDWMIFPPLELYEGTEYKISFYAKSNSLVGGDQLRVSLGTANTAAGMSMNENSQVHVLQGNEFTFVETMVIPEGDGIYYFGIQGFSPAQGSSIFIDDIVIEEQSVALNPPQNLTAQLQNGSVILSWDIPQNSQPDSYNIYRDNVMINNTPVTGTSYTDANIELEQVYTYYVTACYTNPDFESESSNHVIVSTVGNTDHPENVSTSSIKSIYPNPFKNNANICIQYKAEDKPEIKVFNVKGQLVKSFSPSMSKNGELSVVWDGKNESGHLVPTGIYFIKMNSAKKQESCKIIRIN